MRESLLALVATRLLKLGFCIAPLFTVGPRTSRAVHPKLSGFSSRLRALACPQQVACQHLYHSLLWMLTIELNSASRWQRFMRDLARGSRRYASLSVVGNSSNRSLRP